MKVLVVTGASGGHFFPALSFLDTLRKRSISTLFVFPRIALKYNLTLPKGLNSRYISIKTIKIKDILSILNFLKGFIESLFIFLAFKPDVVIGFGSLASVPLVFFGWLFRIKTLIHEQNVVPGRANRFLVRFVDRMAISFSETKSYLKNYTAKIRLTGNPLREELQRMAKVKAREFFNLIPNRFTILVMGGSKGAHKINEVFLASISKLSDKSKFQVIHLTGNIDYEWLKESYEALGICNKCFRFLPQMQYAYSATDLIVCRAGATTISEIIFFKLPAVIIPYPFALGHQFFNAKVLEDKGCALIIKENIFTAESLTEILEDFIWNPERCKAMQLNFENIPYPDANNLLLSEVLSLS
ncbi:MAG: undecaprenyldiphospho-muramoylpentapeptide beta-N-acetylglucosaminyltransferase [Candidatus Omnitrophica bacterium]|nr:undecaprenyldiphospho-muramoylpentapeptide beta-N-acetylglucosaminyltransferase [Candidatus Omnitrophota bacterium]